MTFGLFCGYGTLSAKEMVKAALHVKNKKGQLEGKLQREPALKLLGKLLLKCCLALQVGRHNRSCLKINGLKPTCIYWNNFMFILYVKKDL